MKNSRFTETQIVSILKEGETAVIGSELESAGDGDMQVHTADTADEGLDSASDTTTIYQEAIVGIALEAKDLSDSSGADPATRRILCLAK